VNWLLKPVTDHYEIDIRGPQDLAQPVR